MRAHVHRPSMRPRVFVTLTAGVLLGFAGAAAAHHSFSAEFDANKPITLHGTITKLEWINPHSWLHVNVKNPDGTVTEWMVEGATPNTLLRRGFTRDTVKAGTEITIVGYQAKSGAHRANGRDLILADGSHLFMGSAVTVSAGEHPEAPPEE